MKFTPPSLEGGGMNFVLPPVLLIFFVGVYMLRGSVRSGNSSSHTFSRAPQAGIPRSKFNRTFGVKTTFNEGYLVPIFADEMLPGDTFS